MLGPRPGDPTPLDICRDYAAGVLSRDATVAQLAHYPYGRRERPDETEERRARNEDRAPRSGPVRGEWSDVQQALRDGLISVSMHDQAAAVAAGAVPVSDEREAAAEREAEEVAAGDREPEPMDDAARTQPARRVAPRPRVRTSTRTRRASSGFGR